FENWHSALEMKLYIKRFIHHIGGLPDFKALRFTKYNQYESMILPMVRYLEGYGVQFHYHTKVVNVEFNIQPGVKQATRIELEHHDQTEYIDLSADDLVFITNGGCVENATIGSQNKPADFRPEIKPGGGWDMWRRIASQDPSFGHPNKFCFDPEQTNWMSATVTTLDDRIIPYIERICKRDPFSGGVVTGGIVTVRDSGWLMSWTVNRQPQFRSQPKGQCLVWVYGLFTDRPGDYIRKPMRDCTGKEICEEWLYHLGVPEKEIPILAERSANTVPVMMPYITAFFMPREKGDRPAVVPEGAVNFAFLGQFAETARDTIFTTEYSMRTGMEAVYTLLNIDRGVPEVWGSTYDIRDLLNATVQLRDGRPLTDMKLGIKERAAIHEVLKRIEGTDIEKLLREYKILSAEP
ncbi:MAG: oleate hydratase, partial [Clostridia bacterium]|nr:oleate hydratase [Clostridia bacterium]